VGVGQPIPNVELCIIDPDTGKLLPSDQDGEVCIQGPNVFHGYLGSQKSPFIELQGRKWYRSGDRGHIAPDGSLVLTGRLKRFTKIGGEMISLGGLEEEILRLALERKWLKELKDTNPPLAVAVLEKESEKPLLILFATFTVEKEEINHALRDLGYGRLIKIAEVRKIDQIPVTATGKIQLSRLDELLKNQ
jgi:long-chain-fatty-acid--[acyl-carrier-protein] ligase